MSLTIEIPTGVQRAIKLPESGQPRRLLLELACARYARRILSCGKAAELTGLSRFELGLELGARDIPRHYDNNELQQDVEYAAPWMKLFGAFGKSEMSCEETRRIQADLDQEFE